MQGLARGEDGADRAGSIARYVWRFEPAEPRALAKDLKRRGWRFVGPTTTYAFMQAMGRVNDHLEGCDVRPQMDRARRSFERP